MRRSRFWFALVGLTAILAGVSYSQGPLTNAGNLMVRSDSNGSLSVFGVAAGAQGPLTNFSNLRLRTYNGGDLGVVLTGGSFSTPGYFPDGTVALPGISFANNHNQGIYSQGLHALAIVVNGTSMVDANDINGVTIGVILRASNIALNGNLAWSATPPTISGFGGTGAAVIAGSNTAAWRINVGTVAPGTTGTINLPTATTGWNCWMTDQTTPLDITRQTSSGTASVGITTTIAWSASDILVGGCAAF